MIRTPRRARNVTADGFRVTLYEEQALMDGHGWEELGYLAIYSPRSLRIDQGGGHGRPVPPADSPRSTDGLRSGS